MNKATRYRKFRLTAISASLACFSLVAALAPWHAGAQSTAPEASLASLVEDLESDAGLVAIKTDPISKRMAGLELKIFGSIQSGSLIDRITKLRKQIDENKEKDASQEPSSESTPASEAVPDDPIRKRIKELSRAIPPTNTKFPQFFRVEPTEPVSETDYIDDILAATQKKVMRFKVMPIPVYIYPYQVRSYTRACIEGFESWEHRTDGKVRFVQVDSPNQARIRVAWKRLGMATDGDNCALGAHTVTKWQKNSSGKVAVVPIGTIPLPVYIPRLGPKYTVPAQVVEVNLDLIDAKASDYRFVLLKNIVTHELGHALGLLGHSNEKSDMMFAVTDENSRISQRDINTLSKLYDMKVDIPL